MKTEKFQNANHKNPNKFQFLKPKYPNTPIYPVWNFVSCYLVPVCFLFFVFCSFDIKSDNPLIKRQSVFPANIKMVHRTFSFSGYQKPNQFGYFFG